MDEIKVNTEKIRISRDGLRCMIEELNVEQSALEEALLTLVNVWKGESKDVWVMDVLAELAELKGTLRNLRNLADYESMAIQDYEACEMEISGWIEG